MSDTEKIKDLEAEIARLQKELKAEKEKVKKSAKSSKKTYIVTENC